MLDWFAEAAIPAPRRGPSGFSPSRDSGVQEGWLGTPEIPAETLAGLELFASLDGDQLARVAGWGRERRVEPGSEVVREWDAARDFFVVLEGTASVELRGEEVARLDRGDFFGELAALDWGAGYGHARSATVKAIEPLRLLALAPAHLNLLMAEAPSVDERINSAVRDRLTRT